MALCLVLLGEQPVDADSVLLKDGRQVDGTVVAQTKDTVRVSAPDGIKTIQKATIQRIIFGRTPNKTKRPSAPLTPAASKQAGVKAPPGRSATELPDAARPRAESASGGFGSPSPLAAAWRSALLPGWGQRAAGESAAGLRFGAGFLASAAYAANRLAAQRDAHRAYDRQARDGSFVLFERVARTEGADELKQPLTALHILLTNAAKHPYHTRVRELGQALSIMGLVYLAQIVHAAWLGMTAGVVSTEIPGGRAATFAFSCDCFFETRGRSLAKEAPFGLAVSVRF